MTPRLSLQEQLTNISNSNASQILLGGHMLGSACVDELISSPYLAKVTLLHIGGNFIGDQGLAALVASPYVCELEELVLLQNHLSPKSARALAASPNLHRLSKLNLCNNYLGDEGLRSLLRPFAPPTWVERFFLWLEGPTREVSMAAGDDPYRQAHPKPEGHIAKSSALGTLDWLDLGWNKITDEGARSLAGSPLLRQLSYLNLQNNSLHYAGLTALLESPYMHDFLILNASGNVLSTRDRYVLREAFGDRLRL